MLKQVLAAVAALFAAVAFAAVDVNKATQAELESVKGVGPGIAVKILDERKKGSFKDWAEFVDRVKGIGEGNAAKLSTAGLTVGGASFKAAAPVAKKDDKPAAKAAATAKPVDKATAAAKPADKAAADKPAAAAPMVAKAKVDKPAKADAAASAPKK